MRMYSTKTTFIFSLLMVFGALQMFAQPANTMTISAPASLAGDYTFITASFGDIDNPIGGSLLAGDDGVDTGSDACTPLTTDLTGSIGLIDRGACEFGIKVLNTENAGAVAVLVCNNQPGDPISMGPGADGDAVTVFAGMIRQDDCNTIRAVLGTEAIDVSFSYIAPPCNAMYDETVVWGENGEGAFEDGLGDWSTAGVTAETDLWIHSPLAQNMGVLNSASTLVSPTQCNGSALIDFDFISTGGSGDVLNSLGFPYPAYTSQLTSPSIDLTGTTFPILEFYQYNLPLNGSTSFAYSIDDGNTWSDEVNIDTENVLSASVNNVVGTEFRTYPIQAIAGQAAVRVRFTATNSDFYFWMIDDVVIRNEEKIDIQANTGWVAYATNYKTPVDHVDAMPFMMDVENVGTTDVTGVSLQVEVENTTTGEIVHTDALDYGTIAGGFLDENRIFPNTFTPDAVVADYEARYTLVSDNDTNVDNDGATIQFKVTENEFAKVVSESEAGTQYLGDRATPNEYYESYGNYYYVKTANGKYANSMRFGVNIDDIAASPGFITINLYQWIDLNNDNVCSTDERITLSNDDILVSEELTADMLRDMQIDFTSLSGSPIALEDNSHYIVMAHMRPLANTGDQYRIVSAAASVSPEINYGAMTFALDSLGTARYGSFIGQGADSSTGDVESRDFSPSTGYTAYMPMFIGDPISAVDDLNNSLNVDLFPNPASDQLIVNLILEENNTDVRLDLVNLDGKLLMTQTVNNYTNDNIDMNITQIPAGIYMLNISTEEGYTAKKVVVTK